MKRITQDLKISGIYCIINIKNSKKYIGSSKNIRQRLWSHRAELRHNKHENSHLQNAWNKYGEHNFDYYILEKCEESLLLEKEQLYIDTINPEYNMNKETQWHEFPQKIKQLLKQLLNIVLMKIRLCNLKN